MRCGVVDDFAAPLGQQQFAQAKTLCDEILKVQPNHAPDMPV
jgi:hypothetical protein